MEDATLEKAFKNGIDELEGKGYAPIVIHESFDRVAPPLPWQHNWLILLILAAGVLFGLLLVPLALFGSLFLQGSPSIIVTTLLFGLGGFLFYFALSAFNIHEWVKSLFTALSSVIVVAGAVLARRFVVTALNETASQLHQLQTQMSGIQSQAAQFGITLPSVPGSTLLSVFSSDPLPLGVFVITILLAYNLWPLLFWTIEKIQSRRKTEKRAGPAQPL